MMAPGNMITLCQILVFSPIEFDCTSAVECIDVTKLLILAVNIFVSSKGKTRVGNTGSYESCSRGCAVTAPLAVPFCMTLISMCASALHLKSEKNYAR